MVPLDPTLQATDTDCLTRSILNKSWGLIK